MIQFLVGVLLFTFLEYWTHRIVLHRIMWHSTHQRHHTHPQEYVALPWWYYWGGGLASFILFPFVVWLGFLVGAIWFFTWHWAIHHAVNKPQWVKTYERWHDLHHADLPVNYGITHPLWDMVFGTYMSYKDGLIAIRARNRR